MRLWHKDLISFLPQSQLLAQWRELNSIYVKEDNHLLINYVYDYSKEERLNYSRLVLEEMNRRHINIKKYDNFNKYFDGIVASAIKIVNRDIFINHHNEDYLVKCFYNLKEKYDCGQLDFSDGEWLAIRKTFGKRVLAEVQRDLGGVK